MGSGYESFTSSKSFELDTRDPCLDIQLNDSTELWLIQWPRKELNSQDFDGKEFKLKLHHEGMIGSLTNSSGKSYEIVSYGAQVPDAQVFLPTSSGSKSVGKFTRRVSLIPEFDLEEYKRPSISNPNLSSQRGSTARSSQNRSTVLRGRASSNAPSMETQTPKTHRKRSHNNEYQSADRSSLGSSGPGSQVTDASGAVPKASGKKKSNDHHSGSQVSDVSHSEEKSSKKKKSKKEKS